MAPQFEVKAASTTSNFSLQWIEWSDPTSVVDAMKMPTTAMVIAGLATNYMSGDYDPAADNAGVCAVLDSCIYFNVFTAGFTPISSGTARNTPAVADAASAA